jgi:uncharacterized cysteine cluster protein YcgN (CxxCxxCC family)
MCQQKNIKCQEYFKNDPLIETCFKLFTNIVRSSTWRHCQCREYSANDHVVEKCFQLYTNIVKKNNLIDNFHNFILKLKNLVET